MYRGCGIPVAWVVLTATAKGAWRSHWEAMLRQLQGAVPADWTVIVLADRGLYAKWLYQAIQKCGWHPFLRINGGGKVRPQGERVYRSLSGLVSQAGSEWCGYVDCFKTATARLPCTLLARWEAEHSDPWLIVTDLSPQTSTALWYGMRTWIEQGFKDIKRGGWHWEHTKMRDPRRAARLPSPGGSRPRTFGTGWTGWLVLALATLWVVSVGGQADAALPAASIASLPAPSTTQTRATRLPQARRLSCFSRGLCLILAALIKGDPIPLGAFVPEVWPVHWFRLADIRATLPALSYVPP